MSHPHHMTNAEKILYAMFLLTLSSQVAGTLFCKANLVQQKYI